MGERALGITVVTIIESIIEKKVFELARKYSDLKPVGPLPDPNTFQQQKKDLNNKEKEEKMKIQSILNS